MDRAKLNDLSLCVLVLCAVVTTGLVVRRELVSNPTSTQEIPSEPTFVKDWQDALQHGIRIGSAGAPVQIIEFADFQCPYCARFESRLNEARERHGDKLAITFVHSPLPSHEQAEHAARAAECADAQGRFAAMKTLLFERQAVLGTMPWVDLGRQADVPNLERFQTCVDDRQPMERVIHGKNLSAKFGVRGTPTILVNGWLLPRPPTAPELDRIVQDVSQGGTPKLK
jgi:protein-disulfide isomerase